MKKRIKMGYSLLLVVVLVVGGLTACSSDNEKKEGTKKIAVICDSAGQNDNGYNQSAVNGAKKVADELGFEYKVVEPTNGVPAALEALAGDGYDIIYNLEYDFDALIKGVGGSKPIAELYPDTTFICFNDNPNTDEKGNTIHKNVISVLFDVHEASFLAGSLSTQVLEHADILFGSNYKFTPLDKGGRSIGFVGGTNSNGITVFSYGFIEGINYTAKELGVSYDYYAKYDAGFADPALGSTIAGTYFNQGANLIYTVAGGVGDGVTSKAKEEQKLAIQVDANKDNQQPGYVLTSVLKNTEIPVFEIAKALKDGKLGEMENLQNFSLASGATGITDLAEISKHIEKTEQAKEKWEEIKQYLDKLSKDIGDGKIKVTNAAMGDEFDPASCENVVIK